MAANNSPSNNTMGNITNNTGIVTQGQVGNNTIINLGEQVEVKIIGQIPSEDNPDGTVNARIMIDVHPQTRLLAVACGDDVLGVSLGIWTGMMVGESIPQPRSGNCEASYYDGVYGQWLVRVKTKTKDSKFNLHFELPK
jgi:hypothetical protein